jgi:hypothetical protein
MPSDINVGIEISGKDENGSIPPISVAIKAVGLGAHEIIKVRVPVSGPAIVVPIPGSFTTQTLFFLKSDLAVGVQLNAETAITPGGGGVLPAAVLRTGGPNVTTVTLTPNGTTAASVVIIVAGN